MANKSNILRVSNDFYNFAKKFAQANALTTTQATAIFKKELSKTRRIKTNFEII